MIKPIPINQTIYSRSIPFSSFPSTVFNLPSSSKRVFPPQNLLLLLFYLILLSSTLLKRFLESPVPSQSPSNQPLIRPKTRPSTAGRVPPPGSKKGVETRGLVHIIVLANRANRVHSDLQATWLRNIEKSCHSGKHP